MISKDAEKQKGDGAWPKKCGRIALAVCREMGKNYSTEVFWNLMAELNGGGPGTAGAAGGRAWVPVAATSMQSNAILADNLSALEAHCLPAAAWLAASGAARQAVASRLFVNRRGEPDLRLDGGPGLIESAPLPAALYHGWLPGPGAHLAAGLVLGVNCGHGLRRLLDATPQTYEILALEPDAGMLLACLACFDFRAPIESGRLVFVPPDRGELEAAVARLDVPLVHGEIRLLADPVSLALGPDYGAWTVVAQGLLDNFAEDMDVTRRFQDAMCGNELENYAWTVEQGSLSGLEGAARGAAAMVLGAGPSLAVTGPLLAGETGGAITVTALQTMPVLERLGIMPDFCLAFDFRKEMLRLYDGIRDSSRLERTPLIYSTKCDPEVVRRYPGPKLPLWTTGGLAAGLAQDEEMVLDAGGNVGVAMVRFLIRCGVERIVLAGQDFAWTGQRSHAPGHHAHALVRAFNPERHTAFANLAGQTIHSNRAYLAAKRNLEKDARTAGIPIFNLYGGGARIEGCPEIAFTQCLEMGLLQSEPGAKERFGAALAAACRSRPGTGQRPRLAPGFDGVGATLQRISSRLAALLESGAEGDGPDSRIEGRIGDLIGEALASLREPSPFSPLLYNQAVDLAALARSGAAEGFGLEHAARGLETTLAALARALRLREFAGPA